MRLVGRMRLGVLAATAGFLAGCGTAGDRAQSRAVVAEFYDAIRNDDGEAACGLLSASLREQVESQTQQSCAGVIARFDYGGGAVVETEVFITNAKVDLSSGESAFLGREAGGWKLSAIACEPEKGKPADRPFECEVAA